MNSKDIAYYVQIAGKNPKNLRWLARKIRKSASRLKDHELAVELVATHAARIARQARDIQAQQAHRRARHS